jgi:hypothetical protein
MYPTGKRSTRNNQLFCSGLTKKSLSPYSYNTWNNLRIEYLGKFEFVFQNNLGYESGNKEGAFDEKNRS